LGRGSKKIRALRFCFAFLMLAQQLWAIMGLVQVGNHGKDFSDKVQGHITLCFDPS
jgi:hypothetical protein